MPCLPALLCVALFSDKHPKSWQPLFPEALTSLATPRERGSLTSSTNKSPRTEESHGSALIHSSHPEPVTARMAQQRKTTGVVRIEGKGCLEGREGWMWWWGTPELQGEVLVIMESCSLAGGDESQAQMQKWHGVNPSGAWAGLGRKSRI